MAEPVIIGGKSVFLTPEDEPVVRIYAIRLTAVHPPIYVGSTCQSIKRRIRGHIADAQNGSLLPVHCWIRDHEYFCVDTLEQAPLSKRHAKEKYWVSKFTGLLNLTDGGGGLSGHKFAGTEHARRINAALRTGAYCSCVFCGSQFWRKRREIALGHDKFCTRGCYQAWQRGKPKLMPKRKAA